MLGKKETDRERHNLPCKPTGATQSLKCSCWGFFSHTPLEAGSSPATPHTHTHTLTHLLQGFFCLLFSAGMQLTKKCAINKAFSIRATTSRRWQALSQEKPSLPQWPERRADNKILASTGICTYINPKNTTPSPPSPNTPQKTATTEVQKLGLNHALAHRWGPSTTRELPPGMQEPGSVRALPWKTSCCAVLCRVVSFHPSSGCLFPWLWCVPLELRARQDRLAIAARAGGAGTDAAARVTLRLLQQHQGHTLRLLQQQHQGHTLRLLQQQQQGHTLRLLQLQHQGHTLRLLQQQRYTLWLLQQQQQGHTLRLMQQQQQGYTLRLQQQQQQGHTLWLQQQQGHTLWLLQQQQQGHTLRLMQQQQQQQGHTLRLQQQGHTLWLQQQQQQRHTLRLQQQQQQGHTLWLMQQQQQGHTLWLMQQQQQGHPLWLMQQQQQGHTLRLMQQQQQRHTLRLLQQQQQRHIFESCNKSLKDKPRDSCNNSNKNKPRDSCNSSNKDKPWDLQQRQQQRETLRNPCSNAKGKQ